MPLLPVWRQQRFNIRIKIRVNIKRLEIRRPCEPPGRRYHRRRFNRRDESAYITGDSVNVMGGRYIV